MFHYFVKKRIMINYLVLMVVVLAVESLGEKFVINWTITENKGGGEDVINLKSYINQMKWKIMLSGPFDIISNEQEIVNYFLLDSKTGELKLRSHIDRESICKHTDTCRITILISADNNVLEVVIVILDANDNMPQFPMRYKTLSVQENSNIGFEISLPTAEDADSAEFGINKYYIEDSRTTAMGRMAKYKGTTYFRILERTTNNVKIPYLKTIKEIDREQVDQFELILVAEDSGNQRGSCTLTINVADVNDNSPQWPASSIHKKVRECDRQGPLLELQAFDRDDSSTVNGQVKYKISDYSPKLEIVNRIFYIAGSSLFLSSQTLQSPDVGNSISFFITAIDGGGRENDTTVTIEIEDCNDHSPAITLSIRSARITENDKSLKLLTTITVKDDDRDSNSDFNCDLNDTSLLSLTKQHSFHQANGAMLVMYKLEKMTDVVFDREKIAYYSVIIRCIDQGRPPLTGEKMFSVSIVDQNDNPPKFPSKEARFSITENNLIGALIGYVKAIDIDSIENGRITYHILNNEDNIYFAINNHGKIEAKWRFDRELKSSYSFTVMARDNGDPALNDTCEVKITVLDVNDCLPTFKQQYFYQITENSGLSTVQTILGKIAAEDQDLGENGTVHYEISQNGANYRKHGANSSPLLKISSDGTLTVYGVVDRERMTSIQADVVALDSGRPQLSSVTTVIVDILDLNDNKPKFKYSMSKTNYINVSTDSAVGSILANVEAEDPDKGENGTVTYSVMGSKNFLDNSPFQLQPDGRLILIQSIKERDSSVRLPDKLLIKASDGGEPPQFEILNLHIKYIMNEHRQRDSLWPTGDKNKIDRNRPTNGGLEGYREADSSDNMILLYVLAGVLFTVFLIVLLVLMYTYFSGRLVRGRPSDHSHEKQLNNYCNEGPGNYECELLRAGSPSDARQEDFHKVSAISMSYPAAETGNYTHLMMNESKYTPIQITPNYFQTMCTGPTISHQTSPPINYERVGTSIRNPNRLSNKWNSIENISQTNDTILGPEKRCQEQTFLHNAHSYAAYINQFGKDDAETNVWREDSSNKMRLKQATLPNSVVNSSKDDPSISSYQPINGPKFQPKKSYVTSSFV